MAKKINTRVQHKYDTAENWGRASFIPLRGELIIYGDEEDVTASSTTSPTIKVGDGKNFIEDLKALSGGGSAPDLSNYYTKNEIDNSFYSKEEVYPKHETYSRVQTYNKTEIDDMLSTLGGSAELPKPSPGGVDTDVLLKYDHANQDWVMIEQDQVTQNQDQILMYSGTHKTWSAVPLSIYDGTTV